MITPVLMLNVGNKGEKIVTITGCVVVLVMIAIAVVILIIVIFKRCIYVRMSKITDIMI